VSFRSRRISNYETLTIVTVVATLALIAVGALVRTTESGLGCPDWPLCHGQLIPPAEKTAIIEYSHRTLASVVGLLIVATAWVTLRQRCDDRPLRMLAIVSLPLLAVQAWLGKETVDRELPAEVVTVHLATALVLLSVLAVVAAFAVQGEARRRIESVERASLLRLSTIAAAVSAGVLLIGSYLVGSDAGFACTAWPDCPEAQLPFIDGGRLQHIHWLHRLTVVAGLAAIGVVGLVASNLRRPAPTLQRAVWALLALYGVQILIGALNIWTDFSDAARVAHLAAGAAIWALLVMIVVAGRYEPAMLEAERPAESSEQDHDREASGARA
jgi:heme A synthase